MALRSGHLFFIGSYRENIKNLLVWKQQVFAFWYMSSASGLLPRLFKLLPWTFAKIKLLPWGQKWTHPRAHMF